MTPIFVRNDGCDCRNTQNLDPYPGKENTNYEIEKAVLRLQSLDKSHQSEL